VSEVGTIRLRVVHAIANRPAGEPGINVCWDRDLSDGVPAIELFDGIAFEHPWEAITRGPSRPGSSASSRTPRHRLRGHPDRCDRAADREARRLPGSGLRVPRDLDVHDLRRR
jgi:hypothetical protein